MKFREVVINGKVRRLSERALEILGLEYAEAKPQPPLEIQKLPPNLEILKIQKKEVVAEVPAEPPVEVKKNEDVTAENTEKPKRKRSGRKVGAEE